MAENLSKPSKDSGLRIQHDLGLANIPGGRMPALNEIVNRSLIHIQTSRAQWTLHRVGEHDLYGADYRMVCAWAEELRLTQEEVLVLLLNAEKLGFVDSFGTTLSAGHFRSLFVDGRLLPVSSFPSEDGLMIERLCLFQNKLRDLEFYGLDCLKVFQCWSENLNTLDLTGVPNLKNLQCNCRLKELNLNPVPRLAALDYSYQLTSLLPGSLPLLTDYCCVGGDLKSIDLSPFPSLERLQCQGNQLTRLDLSCVPNLRELHCWDNPLKELDLSPVQGIKVLWFGDTQLTGIDLSKSSELEDLRHWNNSSTNIDISKLSNLRVLNLFGMEMKSLELSANPILSELYCNNNQLTDLDLSVVPNLEKLECCQNPLAELDIRCLKNLKTLKCDTATRIIQRPDQNFK